MERLFDIPNAEYFGFKNTYTGSIGDFRFRLTPAENGIKVEYYETYCYEVAEILDKLEVPCSDEGLEQAAAWLRERYREFCFK